MPRIRTIKPEFWSSEQVMRCSPIARLLFIGMWNFCDDAGRMPLAPISIKAKVFPGDSFDEADIRQMLAELSDAGLLLLYRNGDRDYLQVTGWHHQKIDKPNASRCPDPQNSEVVEYSPIDQRALTPGREGKGEEGKGREGNGRELVASQPVDRRHDDWPENFFEVFWHRWPNKDAKRKAEQSLRSIHKSDRVSFGEILSGVDRYVYNKPNDRAWMLPTTFLNGARWQDEYSATPVVSTHDDRQQKRSIVAAVDRLFPNLAEGKSGDDRQGDQDDFLRLPRS